MIPFHSKYWALMLNTFCISTFLCHNAVAEDTTPEAGGEAEQKAEVSYDWEHKYIFKAGDIAKVFLALSGNVEHGFQNGESKYSFKLGPIEKKQTKIDEEVWPGYLPEELDYAKEVVLTDKGDYWQVKLHPPASPKNGNKNELTAEFLKPVLQGLKLKNQLTKPSARHNFGLHYALSSKHKHPRLYKERHPAREPVVYTWVENQGWDNPEVWWAARQFENGLSVLKIKYEQPQGAIENPPSISQFIDFVHKIRSAFLKGSLPVEDIWSYEGRFTLTVTSVGEIAKSDRVDIPEKALSNE